MGTENENNFETVIIDGQMWAVTSTADREISEAETVSEPGELAVQEEEALEELAESSDIADTSEDVAQSSEDEDGPADVSTVWEITGG